MGKIFFGTAIIAIFSLLPSGTRACVHWEAGNLSYQRDCIDIDSAWGNICVPADCFSAEGKNNLIGGRYGNLSFIVAFEHLSGWEDEVNILGYTYLGDTLPYFETMCRNGDFAYLSTNTSELTVINVSDPQQASIVYTIPQAGVCRDLIIDEGRQLLIAAEWSEVRIYDISLPAYPILLGSVSAQYANAMALRGNILYAACYDQGLRVFDTTDPTSPGPTAYLPEVGHVRDVALWGDSALLVGPSVDLVYLDISTPASPVYEDMVSCAGEPTEIMVSDGHAYIVGKDAWGWDNDYDQILVYQLFESSIPVLVGSYNGFEISKLEKDGEVLIFNDEDLWQLPFVTTEFQCNISGVSEFPSAIPVLSAVWPNPFNPQTTIAFDLPEQESVNLRVFDMRGRLVKELIGAQEHPAGRHEVVWSGKDDDGRQVASGTFFYRLKVGDFVETKRMTMLK